MLAYLAPRMANMTLRGLALVSRFALIIFLARLLTPADVGAYGLFLATVSFSVLVIGGDYYTYTQRELLSRPRAEWSFVLQHQGLGTALLYLLLLPPQLLFFWFDLLPAQWLAWFLSILLVEHVAQEINRLLVAMQRPLMASWVLFIRLGLWVWPLLTLMWFVPDTRTLETIFLAWLIGSTLAVMLGAVIIWKDVAPWRRWPLDRRWITRGFKIGFVFLTATMSFKALQTFDRYIVADLVGPELLGVYVLYTGIAMAVIGFLDPAVFSFLYPRLIRAYREGKMLEYQSILKELAWSATLLATLMAIIAAALAPLILAWTGKAIYQEHLDLLWLLLSMVVIYAIGMIPHYGLYAKGSDRSIMIAHISSLLVFVVVVWLTARIAPLEAAAYGLLAAFTWMGLFKYWRYRRLAHQTPPAVIAVASAQGH